MHRCMCILPSLMSSTELPKGSDIDRRSGSIRDASGDFSPSISFSVQTRKKKAGTECHSND